VTDRKFPNDDKERSPAGEKHTTQHRWDDQESVTNTIVSAVAAVSNEEPTATEPLYEAIDPDALKRLLESLHDSESDGTVQFVYSGYTVTVASDGYVCVQRRR
jgi:mevalonate kinase